MKLFWTTFFWIWLSICSWLLLREAAHTPPPFPHFDKLLHAAGFALLTFTALRAFPHKLNLMLIYMASYAAISEVLQGLLTVTRDASVWDWLADMTGIMLAYYAYQLLHAYENRQSD